jgi:hypothetical protein
LNLVLARFIIGRGEQAMDGDHPRARCWKEHLDDRLADWSWISEHRSDMAREGRTSVDLDDRSALWGQRSGDVFG